MNTNEELKDITPVNYWIGKENKISAQHLQNGERIVIVGFGQSMTPILKSGQPVLVEPVTEETKLSKGDVVFTKVNGHYYLHKIISIRNDKSYQIGNNHGHINGWVSRSTIYGKMVKKL